MIIACIGTRYLTPEQTEILANKGKNLVEEGHLLISGNALGADQAWVRDVSDIDHALYLPWASYEAATQRSCEKFTPRAGNLEDTQPYWNEYAEITKKQPWDKLKRGTQLLQARNYMMVRDCDIVNAAPGWKWENGLQTAIGGTAFGIFLAHKMGKPFNLLQWAQLDYHVWVYNKLGELISRDWLTSGRAV